MKKYLIKNNNIYEKMILTNLKLLILFIPLFCMKNIIYLRINQESTLKLFIIIAFTFWILLHLNNVDFKININELNLPIFLFVLIMTISLINTKYLVVSLREYIVFLFYVILFFLIINNVKGKLQFNSFIKILFLTSTIISIYTIIHYYGLNPTYLKECSEIISPIGQKNLTSNYLVLIFPIIFSYFLNEDNKNNKIIYYLILSINYITIIICQSRGIKYYYNDYNYDLFLRKI